MPKLGCSLTLLVRDLYDDLLIYFYPVLLLNRFKAAHKSTYGQQTNQTSGPE